MKHGFLSPDISVSQEGSNHPSASSNPLEKFINVGIDVQESSTAVGGIKNVSISKFSPAGSKSLLKQSQIHLFGVDPGETVSDAKQLNTETTNGGNTMVGD